MKTKFYLLVMLTFLPLTIDLSAQTGNKKILVAYYSQSGNTQVVAELIKNAVGSDLFRIEPVEPYPANYNELVDLAQKQINSNQKPALKTKIQKIDQYDTIFIGSPCWWSTIAPPVATFLSDYDLSGKTIIPFMTHGGSRMGHSEADIKRLCPKSTILKGLPIRGSQAKQAKKEISNWVAELKLMKK